MKSQRRVDCVQKALYALVVCSAFVYGVLPVQAQWALMRNDADSAVRRGINHIYNLQFDSAEVEFRAVQQWYPAHPVGYFLDAMVDWWRIASDLRDKRTDEQFLMKTDRVIRLCDSLLDINQNDIVGLFFKGGIIGYRGRYYFTRKEWIRAVSDGKEGLDIVLRCWEQAPGNKDVLLGIGLYHYFAAVIPEQYPVVKALLFTLPAGDKAGGLSELKLAAQQARYASVEAKVGLLEIYYGIERNYVEAFSVAMDLYIRYPRNAWVHGYVARCLTQMGNQLKAEDEWRTILARCVEKQRGYDNLKAREAMFYIGVYTMNRRDYETALKYFYKCDEFSRLMDEKPSGWMIMLNLRIGNIYDAQNKRDLAIKQYNKVLSWDDYFNSHQYAKQFLDRPYGK
jgi:hypothetical protein